MNSQTPGTLVMLASVGGTAAPVIRSIQESRPAKIIFFTSTGSYGSVTAEIVPAIMPALGCIPPHEIVQTPDEQDLGQSTFCLLREVPAAMRKLGENAEWPPLVDFTGGTKVMSAALVWASSRYPCQFSYIGADTAASRTKGGLGIVVDGQERCLLRENPWNRIAWFDIKDAVALFNAGQYANAANRMQQICTQVSDTSAKRLFSLILQLWQGYAAWDVFEHQKAIRLISAATQPLNDIAPAQEALWPGLMAFADHNLTCHEMLKGIMQQGITSLSIESIQDLTANALRRIRLENKFDDGTARLYSAIEKLAKYALMKNHGIDNSKCRPEQLPDTLQAEFTRRYGEADAPSGTMQFGLHASIEVLDALGDPLAARYRQQAETFEKLLPLRNNSILGHGITPISRENAEKLLDATLELLDIPETELVNFPQLSGYQ